MEYMYLTHTVKDFDTWKKAFDDHAEVRKGFGISIKDVFQSKEDKNSVSLMARAESAEMFEKFLMNAEVQELMKDAGVIGKPKISWLDCVQ